MIDQHCSPDQRAHCDGVHIISGDQLEVTEFLPTCQVCYWRGEHSGSCSHQYPACTQRHTPPPPQPVKPCFPSTELTSLSDAEPVLFVLFQPGLVMPSPNCCFNRTDWVLFEHQELETFTETSLDYIMFSFGNGLDNRQKHPCFPKPGQFTVQDLGD